MSKQPPPTPTASAIGPIIQISRTPHHWKFTIAPPDHPLRGGTTLFLRSQNSFHGDASNLSYGKVHRTCHLGRVTVGFMIANLFHDDATKLSSGEVHRWFYGRKFRFKATRQNCHSGRYTFGLMIENFVPLRRESGAVNSHCDHIDS